MIVFGPSSWPVDGCLTPALGTIQPAARQCQCGHRQHAPRPSAQTAIRPGLFGGGFAPLPPSEDQPGDNHDQHDLQQQTEDRGEARSACLRGGDWAQFWRSQWNFGRHHRRSGTKAVAFSFRNQSPCKPEYVEQARNRRSLNSLVLPVEASISGYDPAAWTAAIQTNLRDRFGGVRYGKNYRPTWVRHRDLPHQDKLLIAISESPCPLRKSGHVVGVEYRATC
jgi:hypothetical protein